MGIKPPCPGQPPGGLLYVWFLVHEPDHQLAAGGGRLSTGVSWVRVAWPSAAAPVGQTWKLSVFRALDQTPAGPGNQVEYWPLTSSELATGRNMYRPGQ